MTGPDTRIGMRCDAGVASGVGHVVRCLALAEELRQRGLKVTFFGDVDGVPWLRRQLVTGGYPVRPGPTTPVDMVESARAHGLDAVVFDSYDLDPACAGAVREAGPATLAIVDGHTRGQVADLYVDQNLDAELAVPALPTWARRLAGLRYALVRSAVLEARPAQPPTPPPGSHRARVLCFFGGTDAYGAAPVVLRHLLATDRPLSATVVAARADLRRSVESLPTGPQQAVTVIGPTDQLPTLVTCADLVISAAGTSTWDLLCLGVPVALIWVAENQRLGFDRVVARDLAVGLGRLADLAADHTFGPATAALSRLLSEPARRADLARRGWNAVDGHGRARVADALCGLIGRTRAPVVPESSAH